MEFLFFKVKDLDCIYKSLNKSRTENRPRLRTHLAIDFDAPISYFLIVSFSTTQLIVLYEVPQLVSSRITIKVQ